MVGGGWAQVGGKAILASSVRFSPHLRQAACSLPAVFSSFVVHLFVRFWFLGSFLPLKTLIFAVFKKSYQQSVFLYLFF
jgi:hypothetical protein